MQLDRRRGKLTNFQIFTLVANSMIATGIYTIARTTAEKAGRAFWLSILLAVVFSLLQLTGMYLLSRRFPEQSLAEYAPIILGKWVGSAYLLSYFLVAIGLAVVVPRNYWLVVATWVYRNTPQYALMVPLALVCWNVARRGVVVLSRMSEIFFILTVPILFVLVIPHRTFETAQFLPVFEHGPLDVVKGIFPAYFAMTGFDIFLFVYPFTSRRRSFASAGLGVITVGMIYTIASVMIVGSLGLELTLISVRPLQTYLNHFSFAFLERADIVILIIWTFQVISTVMIPLFIAGACLRGVFPKLGSKPAADIALVVLLIGILAPVRFPLQQRLQDIYSLAALVLVGLLPTGLWLLAVIRGIGGVKNAEEKKVA